ncbi:short-chain dehydrogenase [Sphingobium sp. 22B]|uniref:SDR family NAD(P)-dependent oxidoreductase n=1 Tax=unclassified Sphingobium TaxID=2611147 RepID=UPI0007827C4D|nr:MULTISPECIES: SDR family oxidoreductase [unclassified Sphingobium]KXU30488.1 short-chain dehydrogenase [Sphingobium sp. AM]KYC30747.1 short-chain dehydrogenase [Sphingobium sp. 22B]OAP30046.1 short-chain dehydrogenase [Sphingobium sp. 20006FA]
MSINGPLTGKSFVVVGGTGAIGSAAARALSAEGAVVHIADRAPAIAERGAAVLDSLAHGGGLHDVDITSTASLQQLRDSLSAQCGGALNGLINASGFTKAIPHGDLDALTDAFIDEMLQVNWRAQFATVRELAPLLKASGDGLVVSLSSIASFTAVGSNIAYCAAKAGIDVMTKALARVLAPEVRVLAVSPGVVDTSFVPGRGADFSQKVADATPLKRIASADDIARAIAACATHLTYSTGHIIQVDGGRAL